jgi:hypothetical protein
MVVLARPNYVNRDANGNVIPPAGGMPSDPVLPRALRLPPKQQNSAGDNRDHYQRQGDLGARLSHRLRPAIFGFALPLAQPLPWQGEGLSTATSFRHGHVPRSRGLP